MSAARESFISDYSAAEGATAAVHELNDPISFSTIQASNETPPMSAKLPTSGIVSPAPPLLGLDMSTSSTGTAGLTTNSVVAASSASTGAAAAGPSAFKITQLGPVGGSNVVVSRMDQPGPSPATASAVAAAAAAANNIYNTAAARSVQQSQTQRLPPGSQKFSSNFGQFYHSYQPQPHAHSLSHPQHSQLQQQQNLVTKFTNMTVSNAGGKNPLKPTHYTINSPQPNSNNSGGPFQSSSSAGISSTASVPSQPPRTTLKAADLIHILPNLVNTLKRRHSQSGHTGNALAAAVAAAAASTGGSGVGVGGVNPVKSAAAFVAEQLLNVASTPLTAEDLGSSASPSNNGSSVKRVKIHSSSSLHQCEVCGKIYKHRNCLSKHRWEHHDAWEHTKKVCQTKHQQVQLLEAAQVLAEIMLGVQPGQRRHLQESSEGEDAGDGDEYVEIDGQQEPVQV